MGSSFEEDRAGFDHRLKRLHWCFWISFWDEIGQCFDRTIFFRIWNRIHSVFFWGVCFINTTLPIFLFCFMRKCGVHVSIIICIDNEWIYFQLLMEFQSPGNKVNCYNKPDSKAQNDRIFVSKQVCWNFFQITFRNYFFVFNWFCQPLFQIFLQFAIKDCIAPLPSPDNI